MPQPDLLHVDPDIRRARTIPSAVYTDPDLFDRLGEAVFARSWQLVADAGDVRTPGRILPFLLRGPPWPSVVSSSFPLLFFSAFSAPRR